ncbi:MAG: ABC transporter ATP-binding protein [Gemmataceae bacterium]
MIRVSNLTKFYGDYAAVRDVSFEVPKGQIVGFLGPNGAGKSTTMRILAGFLSATSGEAAIDGFDVFRDSVEVRRRIGYMPENCPLYTDMRVREYLHFRAGIKGLHGWSRRERLDFVMERCWLTDVRRQIIGTLSKGYRQRVGLADALLADPPVLILDEPTAGLDPTQIRASRQLIRELGKEHTILLSTHILSEVEMTCDNVIIIHKGKVAASGSLRELEQQASTRSVVTAETDEPIEDLQPLERLEFADSFETEPAGQGTRIRVKTEKPGLIAQRLCALSIVNDWKLREVRPQRQTLEDLFVQITGAEEDTQILRVPASAGKG